MQVEERLNEAVDQMRNDRSPLPRLALIGAPAEGEVAEELAILRMAAALNAMRPDAGVPNPGFISGLRERVLVRAGGGIEFGS